MPSEEVTPAKLYAGNWLSRRRGVPLHSLPLPIWGRGLSKESPFLAEDGGTGGENTYVAKLVSWAGSDLEGDVSTIWYSNDDECIRHLQMTCPSYPLLPSPMLTGALKGREGESEEEKKSMCERYIDRLPLTGPPTGNLACNPGMCPDWELHQWSFGSQAGTQSTELHQPGLH